MGSFVLSIVSAPTLACPQASDDVNQCCCSFGISLAVMISTR